MAAIPSSAESGGRLITGSPSRYRGSSCLCPEPAWVGAGVGATTAPSRATLAAPPAACPLPPGVTSRACSGRHPTRQPPLTLLPPRRGHGQGPYPSWWPGTRSRGQGPLLGAPGGACGVPAPPLGGRWDDPPRGPGSSSAAAPGLRLPRASPRGVWLGPQRTRPLWSHDAHVTEPRPVRALHFPDHKDTPSPGTGTPT